MTRLLTRSQFTPDPVPSLRTDGRLYSASVHSVKANNVGAGASVGSYFGVFQKVVIEVSMQWLI
jgi:hypothetical protein